MGVPSSRWKEVEELFGRASDLPEPEREEFMEQVRSRDAALHSEVRSLLESSRDARQRLLGLVETQAESLAESTAAVSVGQQLGAYRLGEVIGVGGMGAVYSAERDDGQYRRKVAIKILQDRLTSPHLVARFRDERRILATLDHPGIVRLLDGGGTEQGVPYIVMEHVTGTACTTYLRDLPVRKRVELILKVCDAVQYAHQKLVVHRDIKPSNILVTPDGEPKLLDFGIAKLLDPSALAIREAKTRTGVALLTPEYASPEQARGETVSVGTDVYSLGAVLYELLAGQPPHLPAGTLLETLNRICEVMPLRPSSMAKGASAREVAGDLDSIVLKALQKDATQRYASVADLAADLQRFLKGLPVVAREATWLYRAGKFVARNRARLALAALLSATLLAATAVSIYQARRAEEQTRRAELQTRTLLSEQGLQELANGRAGRALPYLVQIVRDGDDTPALRFVLAEAVRPLSRELASRDDFPEGISGILWSPDGTQFAATGHGAFARFYDRSGRLLSTLDARAQELLLPSISLDGRRFAALGSDNIVRIWNLPEDTAAPILLHSPGQLTGGTFDPSGERFLTGARDGYARIWKVADGREALAIAAGSAADPIESCAFSTSGTLVATGTADGRMALWKAATGEKLFELGGHQQTVRQLRFAGDDSRLFSASNDTTVRIWDVATGKAIATLSGHSRDVPALDVSPDDTRLVSVSSDNTAKVWDARSGGFIAALVGHTNNGVWRAHFSPDSLRIVTTGGDNTYRLWDAASGAAQALLESTLSGGSGPNSFGRTVDARFSPDGALLLTAAGTELKLWGTGREPLITEILTGTGTYAAAFSPDERLVAAVGEHGLANVWDLATGQRTATLNVNGEKSWDVFWNRDATRILIVGENGTARIFPATGGDALVTLLGHRGRVNRGSFSPDGAHVLTAGSDRVAHVWDAATGSQLFSLDHPLAVMSATWSPDGTRIATAGWDHFLRVWDRASGQLSQTLEKSRTQLLDVTFSPDGTKLASSGHDGEVALWSLASGTKYLSLDGHSGPVTAAVWSPDGALIATSADDQTARIWDAATGRLLGTRAHRSSVMQVVWSHDGTRILTAGVDQMIHLWDVHREQRSVAELEEFAAQHAPWRLMNGRLELAKPAEAHQ